MDEMARRRLWVTLDLSSIRDATQEDSSVVYFVQATHGGPIKIGTSGSSTLKSRLSSLQTGSPTQLVVRRVVAGDRELERRLHNHFEYAYEASPRLVGEWFEPVADLVELARARGDAIPDDERARVYQKGYDAGYGDAIFDAHEAAVAATERTVDALNEIERHVYKVYEKYRERKLRAHMPPVELLPIRGRSEAA